MDAKHATRHLIQDHAAHREEPLTPERIREALGWRLINEQRKGSDGRDDGDGSEWRISER